MERGCLTGLCTVRRATSRSSWGMKSSFGRNCINRSSISWIATSSHCGQLYNKGRCDSGGRLCSTYYPWSRRLLPRLLRAASGASSPSKGVGLQSNRAAGSWSLLTATSRPRHPHDKRLAGADMEATGHFATSGLFMVDPIHTKALHVYKDGKRRTISYWCDTCSSRTTRRGFAGAVSRRLSSTSRTTTSNEGRERRAYPAAYVPRLLITPQNSARRGHRGGATYRR